MKITHPAKDSSFYVSLSDMLFCVLILFIVLVMCLVLEMKPPASGKSAAAEVAEIKAKMEELKAKTAAEIAEIQAKSKAEMKKFVWSNRFSGGVDSTVYYVAHVPIEGKTYLIWVPQMIAARANLIRSAGRVDPVLDICTLMKQEEGLTFTSAEDFLKMKDDVSAAFIQGMLGNYEVAHVVHRARAAQAALPAEFAGWSPEQLRDAIGGVYFNSEGLNQAIARIPALHPAILEYEQWSGMNENNQYKRQQETATALLALLQDRKDEPPFLRFRVTPERRVRIGGYEMSPAAFRNILRSIKPGKGFYIEYVGLDGKEAEPPEWVMKEILAAVGFDGRILSDQGLKTLGEKK